MLPSPPPVPRTACRPRRTAGRGRNALLCVASLGILLGATALPAQTRVARSAETGAARATVDATSFTHFLVEEEQTAIVHRGRAVAVGQARDRFSSWLALPGRSLAAAGVRADDAGTRALVVMVDGSGEPSREILVPSARGATQATPKLLAPRANGHAFGVIWFEGNSQQQRELFFTQAEERAGGVAFSRPLRLAGRAPGSQVALDAVTLPDGRYLATWSGFDGTDTEIFYTVGDGQAWSRPQPLHAGDDTPDSFPTLIATESGALVAWNSFEGHTYAVMTSAFDGTGWSIPQPVVAEPGAEPMWSSGADRPLLSFRQGDQWTLVETSVDGRSRRRTQASPSEERPTVLAVDDRGLVLRGPSGRDSGRATDGTVTRVEAVTQQRPSHATAHDAFRVDWKP